MKNKNLLKKIAFASVIAAILVFSAAMSAFAQAPIRAPKQEKLLNGLKVLMWSDAQADKVSVKIRIHAGSAFDPQGKEGAMQLLADDLFPNDASREFFAEDLGGGLDVVTTYDFIQINAWSKPESFLTMLETLAAAVSNPAIDKDTTAKLRTALFAKLKVSESDPGYVADQAVAKRLFGTFPYGRPQRGSTASVQKIDFADLIDAKQRFLTSDNATIAITGNFERDLGYRAVRRYFGSWLKSDKRVPATFRQPDSPPTGLQTITSPKPGVTAIRFAVRGTSRSDKDFAAGNVFSTILESRLKARVPTALMSNVFVQSEAFTLPGYITIRFSAGTREIGSGNGKVDLSDLIAKSMAEPITDAEFQAARSANAAAWNKRDPDLLWLDYDTYKTLSIESDRLVFENLSLSDLRVYAEKLRSAATVSVFLDTPIIAG